MYFIEWGFPFTGEKERERERERKRQHTTTTTRTVLCSRVDPDIGPPWCIPLYIRKKTPFSFVALPGGIAGLQAAMQYRK
jgi:hypothetical protein